MIRTINVSDGVDTLHVDGSRFFLENRFEDPDHPGERAARPLDTIHYGISERFSLIAKGGAGGPLAVPGDYLYMNAHRPSLPSGRLGHHPRPARPHCEPAAAAGPRGAGLDLHAAGSHRRTTAGAGRYGQSVPGAGTTALV